MFQLEAAISVIKTAVIEFHIYIYIYKGEVKT